MLACQAGGLRRVASPLRVELEDVRMGRTRIPFWHMRTRCNSRRARSILRLISRPTLSSAVKCGLGLFVVVVQRTWQGLVTSSVECRLAHQLSCILIDHNSRAGVIFLSPSWPVEPAFLSPRRARTSMRHLISCVTLCLVVFCAPGVTERRGRGAKTV